MNLELDEFVVMPNHFHGIVIIGENKFNRDDDPDRPDSSTDAGMASLWDLRDQQKMPEISARNQIIWHP
jgi:hypothetical protein